MSAVLKFLAAARSLANQGLSKEAIQQFAKNEFGEICYMSCGLLNSKSTLLQQFQGNAGKYSFEVIFRIHIRFKIS